MVEHPVAIVVVVPEVFDPVTVGVGVAQVEVNGFSLLKVEEGGPRTGVHASLVREPTAQHFCIKTEHTVVVQGQHATAEILGCVLHKGVAVRIVTNGRGLGPDTADFHVGADGQASRLKRHLVSVLHDLIVRS